MEVYFPTYFAATLVYLPRFTHSQGESAEIREELGFHLGPHSDSRLKKKTLDSQKEEVFQFGHH